MRHVALRDLEVERKEIAAVEQVIAATEEGKEIAAGNTAGRGIILIANVAVNGMLWTGILVLVNWALGLGMAVGWIAAMVAVISLVGILAFSLIAMASR
jgi:hypothetical protein